MDNPYANVEFWERISKFFVKCGIYNPLQESKNAWWLL